MLTRRDFLDGVALAIAAGLTPAAQLAAQPQRYPPALTGLRGDHPGSFETAHAFAREGERFSFDDLPIEESYDLVVVGGGISGLAAAYFYRRAVGPQARILILDNHDDFGGHAKRNEFSVADRRIIGYGGSESMQSPKNLYSPAAKELLRELGIDLARFETAFDRNLYASLGLSRSLFFAREAFGRDVLVVGEALTPGDTQKRANARPVEELIARYPLSETSRAQLVALYDPAHDPLAGRDIEDKRRILKTTSYRDYLMKICGLSEEAANCFQGRTLGFFGLGADAVPAADARDLGYPGFAGLALPDDRNPAWEEPYIYHFPDGNAGIARLLVRSLVPGVAPGNTMDDVVEAPFDYDKLDAAANVRIRLNSTCLSVRETSDQVMVGYRARRAITSHCGPAGRARVLPRHDPVSDARAAGAAARGPRPERAHAARLHQRDLAQLAPLGRARRAFDLGADVVSLQREARFPGFARRLSLAARSVRADRRAHGACAECPQPGL